jgi:hypothetical protein
MRKVVALALLALFISLGCGSSGMIESDRKRLAAPTPEQQACSRDSECILVEDCCGCANGGTQQAVRNDVVEELESAGASECADRACTPGVQSAHRSCTASESVCRGGRCIPSI